MQTRIWLISCGRWVRVLDTPCKHNNCLYSLERIEIFYMYIYMYIYWLVCDTITTTIATIYTQLGSLNCQSGININWLLCACLCAYMSGLFSCAEYIEIIFYVQTNHWMNSMMVNLYTHLYYVHDVVTI